MHVDLDWATVAIAILSFWARMEHRFTALEEQRKADRARIEALESRVFGPKHRPAERSGSAA